MTYSLIRNFLNKFLSFFLIFSFLFISCSNYSFVYADQQKQNELLTLIQKKSFKYFWNEVNPKNGLVRDKAFNFKAGGPDVASIAAVGFALTSYPIAVEYGWISKQEAYRRTLSTLTFFSKEAEHQKGFFYHFLDMSSGKRVWQCELSSIDTAIFLAGALFAAQYFKDAEIKKLVNEIYRRVDFKWMMNGGDTLSMGWKPEGGFLSERWGSYDESMILYFLAIGSPTHPIPATSWKKVQREVKSYEGIDLIASPPLFTHQYSHCWIDFRGKHDGYADYFENSKRATITNRLFCVKNANQYKTYSKDIWGLTASDGPFGYKAYGAKPGNAVSDGTVAPTAAISSIVFTPNLSIKFAEILYKRYKKKLWGRYGFCDAFNFEENWKSKYVLGIDLGPMLLMIENYKKSFVWNEFMRIEPIQIALERIGFKNGSIEFPKPIQAPKINIGYNKEAVVIDGKKNEWNHIPSVTLRYEKFLEYGTIKSAKDLNMNFSFQWDEKYLYSLFEVFDDETIVEKKEQLLHKKDLVELFIDPDDNGFFWNNKSDFQFGFAHDPKKKKTKSWLWPQNYNPKNKKSMSVATKKTASGYLVETAIPWELIKLTPKEGLTFQLAPGVHDVDKDGMEAKLIWWFTEGEKSKGYDLGRATLVG